MMLVITKKNRKMTVLLLLLTIPTKEVVLRLVLTKSNKEIRKMVALPLVLTITTKQVRKMVPLPLILTKQKRKKIVLTTDHRTSIVLSIPNN